MTSDKGITIFSCLLLYKIGFSSTCPRKLLEQLQEKWPLENTYHNTHHLAEIWYMITMVVYVLFLPVELLFPLSLNYSLQGSLTVSLLPLYWSPSVLSHYVNISFLCSVWHTVTSLFSASMLNCRLVKTNKRNKPCFSLLCSFSTSPGPSRRAVYTPSPVLSVFNRLSHWLLRTTL